MFKDANGAELVNGDNVQIIKDLKAKGAGTLKRGMVIKNIRLGKSEGEVEARVDKIGTLVLKTCFVKKV